MIEIVGAQGKVSDIENFLEKVDKYSKKNDVLIQVFDADMVFGKNHLVSAYNHAKRAFENGTNTTKSIEMELLLYASGERQLKLAIPKMGVKKGNVNIALVFIDSTDKRIDNKINEFVLESLLKKNDKVLEGSLNTLEKFGLDGSEIKTVAKDKYEDLILEKVAMVDIIK
ncbi:MAG: KEOPS complex subunit Cgi121 [Candidatus Thermoplasmatota archaeon]|nr:KEOPS complex subunit Cgi121 [Candidatus Thermoplasmatota archaeon]